MLYFLRLIALFHAIIIKHTVTKLNAQSRLGGTARQKLFKWRKIILPRGDLTWVDTRPYMDEFILILTICFYKEKYIILLGSHSG